MIAVGVILTILAGISWHPDLYPISAHGQGVGDGLCVGLTGSAAIVWLAAIVEAFA